MNLLSFRRSDFLQFFRPISPVFAFIVPWLIVLAGQQLSLCGIIVPVYSSFYAVILGNTITSILIFFVFSFFGPKKPNYELNDINISYQFKKSTFLGIKLLLTFQILQVFLSRGFPLLWLVLGSDKTYTEYGIQSLNGLLNALYLIVATSMFLICLKERKRMLWILFFFLLLLPILLICRQLMICLCLQASCCLLIYRRKAIKKVVSVFLAALAVFVILGNARTGLKVLIDILQPEPFIPEFLYSFLWIYAYVVTPFNNVNAAVHKIVPLGKPYNEMTQLLPSFIQKIFGLEMDHAGFELVHQNMNVSTFYLPLIQDFGQVYAFCFMAGVQIMLTLVYRKVFLSRHPIDVLQYSVLYMIVVLSIFSNLLLYLPVMFQLFLIFFVQFVIASKRGVLILKKSKAL